MPRLIRVLHAINWFRRGGVETQLLRMLREYDRSRFHMDVCVYGDDPGYLAGEARSAGAEILRCRKSVNLFDFSARFRRVISGRDYDVVHAHADAWSGPLLRAASQSGVKVRIAHLRLAQAWPTSGKRDIAGAAARAAVLAWGRRWLERYATHVLSVSEVAMDLRWSDWRNYPDRFMVWTGGVNTARFTPSTDTELQDIPIVVTVGSLTTRKRHDILLRMFARVLRSGPEARLVLIGEGPTEAACRDLAEQLGISRSVDFMGLQDRDSVAALLKRAWIFVTCSESEGLPNCLLEAQAAGVAVVASNIPEHREALAPEFEAWLFPLHAPEQGAENIVKLLHDRTHARELGRLGRAFVEDRFSSQRQLRLLENHYLRCVNSREDCR